MFSTSMRIPVLLVCLFTFTSACTATSSFKLNDAKRLYQEGHYIECIRQSKIHLSRLQKTNSKAPSIQEVSACYEIVSDCYERLGDAHNAAKTIETLLSKNNSSLSREETARLRLKTADQLKGSGCFSEALVKYRSIAADYSELYPDRFVKYAQDNIVRINKKQNSIISGKIIFIGVESGQQATIRAFNGFEESSGQTDSSGRYTLPLFNTTPRTKFIFSVIAPHYTPIVKTIIFDGNRQILLDPIHIEKKDTQNCVVTGMLYKTIRGGKLKYRRGISLLSNRSIRFTPLPENSAVPITAKSNQNGIFKVELSPGTYQIIEHKRTREIKLTQGEVKIMHIRGTSTIID